ncbi:MAG: AAA family ATPase [Actinomycetota bacterium]|nr:AAA family ATPase [Actinomycetota bacterium]
MGQSGADPGPREAFAQRFALLYAEAGDPPLRRVTAAVARTKPTDDLGRPVRVTVQRVSDWRGGRNVPARFAAVAPVLQVLIGQARKARPHPCLEGLYDMGAWRRLWEEAMASPVTPAAGQPSNHPLTSADSRPAPDPGKIGVCPYKGLAAFSEKDADWFFGRERSTATLLVRLRGALNGGGIVMLVGASGAGKSSLINAGLLPALAQGALTVGSENWPVIIMTPGIDPLDELLHHVPELTETLDTAQCVTNVKITEIDTDPAETGQEADAADGSDSIPASQFASCVRTACAAHAERKAGDNARLIVVVDQFEEAFTLCGSEQRRQLFVRALGAASTPEVLGGIAPAMVVVGVRADFYSRCLGYPELAAALQDRQMVLGPMTAEELRKAVTSPAKAVGLKLEAGLVELMSQDLGVSSGRARAGMGQQTYDPGALPLLSHAVLSTWQRRESDTLTISGYRAAGGIHGAVAETAERAWAELDPAGQAAARAVLLQLVRLGDDTKDTRRRATREDVLEQAGSRAAAQQALEVLARARLVMLDARSVEITHEALLEVWPRLRSWIDEDRAGHLARQRLVEDAAVWDRNGRDPSLLYRGSRLENARHLTRAVNSSGPTGLPRDFLIASTRQWRRSVWVRRIAVATVVAFALIAASAAAVAMRQRDEAVFRQVMAEADRMQEADPSLSAQLTLVAHQMRPRDNDVYTRLVATQNTPLATRLVGHNGAVYLTSFSPDGHTLATASYDRTVRLWDTRDKTNPRPLGQPLTGHTSWVTSAVFSPDGRTLATAGDDQTVRLWDVTDPAHPMPLGAPLTSNSGTIYLVAFSPDGRVLATANEDHTARLWNLSDLSHPVPLGQPMTGHQAPVRSIAFSPDGRTLATTGDDTTVRLWNLTDPANPMPLGRPLSGHDDGVHSIAFSPDGRLLATGSTDKTVRLWDVGDATHPAPLGQPLTAHDAPVWSVAFSPDGRLLATSSEDATTKLWNLADPTRVAPFIQPLAAGSSTVFAVAFSPDGHALATGSEDGDTRLWSIPTAIPIDRVSDVSLPALSPDGRLLAAGSNDRTVQLWDVTNPTNPVPHGQPLIGHSAGVWRVAFGPKGHLLASGGGDKTVRLWDVRDPEHPTALGQPITLDTRYIAVVVFSPDGRLLATANTDQTIRLWDVSNPANPVALGQPLTGHSGYVNYVSFSPNGRLLATASSDRTIRLWDVSDPANPVALGQPLTGHIGDVRQVVFGPDGRTLASASNDKTIRLWDVSNPSSSTPLGQPLAGHNAPVLSVAFAPDGRILASGSADQTVRLWDVATPADIKPLGEPLTRYASIGHYVAFSRDGQFLASSSGNTVGLWDLNGQHAIQRICATTRGVLTPERWEQHIPQLSYQPPCQ